MNPSPQQLPSFEDTATAFSAKSNSDLRQSYWLFKLFSNKALTDIGSWATTFAFKFHLPVKPFVRYTVFKQFCGGETLKGCAATVEQLAKFNIQSVLDYGVEGKDTEHDFDLTLKHQLETLNYEKDNKNVTIISVKVTGFGRFKLLEKVHAKQQLTASETQEYNRIRERLDKICKLAVDTGKSIFVDAEETWIQHPLDELVEEMMQQYNTERGVVYNTYQLYCNNKLEALHQAHQRAIQGKYILGAKLVRGAYMEKERERAQKLGYLSPIHNTKAEVDVDYDRALDYCLNNYSNISFCCATHNEESCLHLAKHILERGIDKQHPHIFFSQLYGMGDHITYNLAKAGFHSSKYIPYGPVKEVVPYLVRRAQENSSVSGQVGRELGLLQKEMKRRGL